MKKTILLIMAGALLMFASCKKSKDENPQPTPITSSINWNDNVNIELKLSSTGSGSLVSEFTVDKDSSGELVVMYPRYVNTTIDSVTKDFTQKRNQYWSFELSVFSPVRFQYLLNGTVLKDTIIGPTTGSITIFTKALGNTDNLVRIN